VTAEISPVLVARDVFERSICQEDKKLYGEIFVKEFHYGIR
jgi:hypothetical protein